MVASMGTLAAAPASGPIAGGFVLVPLGSLVAAWRSCRRRPLGPGDFRAWLACHEMLARRARPGIDRAPGYGEAELAGLLGISPRRARGSARRLVGAGLLLWSGADIGFPGHAIAPAGPADEALADSIGSARGALAIPRRLLRLLARGARPALIATALGALLRCLSRRKAGFDGRGRFKASWVARAFGVDKRAVKAARAELVDLRWLAAEGSGQAAMNRWGPAYRIDLAWARPGADGGAPSPPPRPAGGAPSPPPDLHQDPPPGMGRDQEPAPGGPAGVEGRRVDGSETPASTAPGRAIAGPPPPPRLEDVRPEDLRDAGRLGELHRQAAGRGLVGPSEADRLKFAAAAEHAKAVGRGNPCGLFARIVRRGWWGLATLGEEERAARWLREHGRGGVAGRSAAMAGAAPGRLAATLGAAVGAAGRPGIGAGPAGPVVPLPRGRGAKAGGGAGGDGDRWGVGGVGEAEMLARLARLAGGGGGGGAGS